MFDFTFCCTNVVRRLHLRIVTSVHAREPVYVRVSQNRRLRSTMKDSLHSLVSLPTRQRIVCDDLAEGCQVGSRASLMRTILQCIFVLGSLQTRL